MTAWRGLLISCVSEATSLPVRVSFSASASAARMARSSVTSSTITMANQGMPP